MKTAPYVLGLQEAEIEIPNRYGSFGERPWTSAEAVLWEVDGIEDALFPSRVAAELAAYFAFPRDEQAKQRAKRIQCTIHRS